MDEAKMIWRLSNREVEIDYKTGEELDVLFSELKDVRLVK